jgi:hypothetical protein
VELIFRKVSNGDTGLTIRQSLSVEVGLAKVLAEP